VARFETDSTNSDRNSIIDDQIGFIMDYHAMYGLKGHRPTEK